MLELENIFVGAPQWRWPAVVIGLLACGVVAWSYWRRSTSDSKGAILLAAALKVLAIAGLAVCLLQPMLETNRPQPHANLIGIAVDNSRSMTIRGAGQGRGRDERLAGILQDDAEWQVRLSQDFDVRRYSFDRSLQNVESFASLDFAGSASSMSDALQTLATRFRDRPVAGVLLLTDGNATDLVSSEFDWSSLGFPVYPVLESSRSTVADVWIDQVTTAQTNFEASPVTVSAKVQASGLKETDFVVRLVDQEQVFIEERTIELTKDTPTADIQFRFRPKKSGLQFFTLTIVPASQQAAFEKGRSAIEATLANNSRLVAVHRDSGPYRILYVAGRPNWEFKFLRRALQEDDEIRLVALMRIARKEPKFSFRDRGVNSSNPLFSGFDETEEEAAEQYDEPVLLRLGVDEAEQLSKGFPTTSEELFGYDGIILDDVDAGFFTQDQMLTLRQFVSTRGGGLLMLGGTESFGKGGYEHTPLADLMPMYLPAGKQPAKLAGAKIQLTREGWLQPWLRLRETEVAEKKRFAEMPEFTTVNPIGDVKPGASQVAVAESATDKQPALVVQRYGKGRASALLIGDLWRWAMHRKDDQNQDLQQWWRQAVRWMIADVPQPVQIDLDKTSDPSKPINISVTVRDPQFLPLDNASITLNVVGADGESLPIPTQPSDKLPGVYVASYWPRVDGPYRVNVSAANPDGSDIGNQESGWTTENASVEFAQLLTNEELLKKIAEQTGGEVVMQDDLESFARRLPSKKVPLTQRHLAPLWHGPWVLMFALACLCAEWGVRRLRGLP